jgi:hypothetical protein
MNPRRQQVGGVLLLLAACSSHTHGPTGQSNPVNPLDISNVVYVGGATDEALLRLLDAPLKDDTRQYVVLDSPDISAPIPKDTPATFAFHLASQAARAPAVREKATPRRAPEWRSLDELLQLLGPPRIAHAHGIPYNGTAYFLVISDATSNRKLRVFTAQTSYTPEEDTWQSLAQAVQPLTLKITSAFFEENEIPEDGGPFVGGTFELRIQ